MKFKIVRTKKLTWQNIIWYLGPDRQFRPDQLRRRQGRYLGAVQRAGDRGPQIQHPDLDAGAGRADPHDRRPAPL